MQWTADRHGGFSRARKVVRPVISDPVYGYDKVNVAAQRRDPDSLLNWTERMIRMRRECQEISWGEVQVLRTDAPQVLALRFEWRGTFMVTLHNFDNHAHKIRLKVGCANDTMLLEVFNGRHSRAHNDGVHRISLDPYAWRWFRVGAADNTLNRSTLAITDDTVR